MHMDYELGSKQKTSFATALDAQAGLGYALQRANDARSKVHEDLTIVAQHCVLD